jgi:hypothetical protein
MQLATERRRPTRLSPPARIRRPEVWRQLQLNEQAQLAHVLAVLIRRMRRTGDVRK